MCGEDTAAVTCYSFYANKTITTGEGGMAVTDDKAVAESIRLMSLHGLSNDAWGRLFPAAAAVGITASFSPGKIQPNGHRRGDRCHQLRRAEEMRKQAKQSSLPGLLG